MTLGERLRLVRGSDTQKAFAAALGVHENSVANAERRGSATQDYLLRIAEVRRINLHWLLTGHGAMRLDDATEGVVAAASRRFEHLLLRRRHRDRHVFRLDGVRSANSSAGIPR